jgi:hypothetical protein
MSKNRRVIVRFEENKLCCELPITAPTSKVRVKRNGAPLPTRQMALQEGDVIEWQVSYFDSSGNLEELGELAKLAYIHGLISSDEMSRLFKEIDSYKENFHEKFRILRESSGGKFYEFEVLYEKTPILHKPLSRGCFVEVKMAHKQKAVGYQSMVFIYIPINIVKPSPIGRIARINERVVWNPSKEDIFGTIRAFAVASRDHNRDMKTLIKRVLEGKGYSSSLF